MDAKQENQKEGCNVLKEVTPKNVVVGSKQLRKALHSGRAIRVFLARNADPAITAPIEVLCRQYQVECVWVPSKEELGRSCGIAVGAAAAAAVH